MTIRRPGAAVDDGYRSPLLPGLKSGESAGRLAEELAFATARLQELEESPPGLYAELADENGDVEERTWLAFLIAYLGPLEDAEDPFEAIRGARTSWAEGVVPDLEGVRPGPRTAHDQGRGQATLQAYRAWAERAGTQAAGYGGEPAWSPERRFSRVFERLALPGFHRAARFELLVVLGRTGLYELAAGSLALGGSDEVTLAAKRAFGIGDTLLLERRAGDLARACEVPLEALDLGLYNWARDERATVGVRTDPDPELLHHVAARLGLG
ncbi:MAG: hypothetical protein ACJ764_05020 [Solirubrobacteraceae bacterium]